MPKQTIKFAKARLVRFDTYILMRYAQNRNTSTGISRVIKREY